MAVNEREFGGPEDVAGDAGELAVLVVDEEAIGIVKGCLCRGGRAFGIRVLVG